MTKGSNIEIHTSSFPIDRGYNNSDWSQDQCLADIFINPEDFPDDVNQE